MSILISLSVSSNSLPSFFSLSSQYTTFYGKIQALCHSLLSEVLTDGWDYLENQFTTRRKNSGFNKLRWEKRLEKKINFFMNSKLN